MFGGGGSGRVYTNTKVSLADSLKGGETLAFVGSHPMVVGCCDAGNHKGLVDIHPTTVVVNNFEHNTSPQTSI